MGEVPSAGFDPIFWMHHSNVDRLYQNFITANPGQNITLAQLNSVQWPYDFFEITKAPPGNKLVKRTMPEVLADISTIDYKYDERVSAAQATVAQAANVQMKENSLVTMSAKASASLKTTAKLSVDLPVTIKEMLPLASSKSRTILELDVSYKVNHKGRYEVFLDLPEKVSASDKDAEKHFVGAISFFVNDPQGKGGNQVFRYDITDELAASKAEQKNFALSIVKTHGPEEGEITVNKVTVLKLE